MPKPTIYDVYNSTISSLAEKRRKREEEEQKAFEEWLKNFQAEWTAKGVDPVFAAQHPTLASMLAETKRAAAVSSANRARMLGLSAPATPSTPVQGPRPAAVPQPQGMPTAPASDPLRPVFQAIAGPGNYLGATAMRNIAAGVGDVLASLGGASQWLGAEDFGRKLLAAGAELQKVGTPRLEEFKWRDLLDPNFYTGPAARTIPFMLALMPVGYLGMVGAGAGAAAVGAGAVASQVIGSIAGAALSRAIESAMEAGSVYNDAIAKGMTPEEADKAADRTFKGNLALIALDAGELLSAFFKVPGLSKLPKGAVAASRLALTGAQEAGEEIAQEVIQRKALGEKVAWDAAMKEAGVLGGLMGIGMGGAGAVRDMLEARAVSQPTQQPAAPAPAPAPQAQAVTPPAAQVSKEAKAPKDKKQKAATPPAPPVQQQVQPVAPPAAPAAAQPAPAEAPAPPVAEQKQAPAVQVETQETHKEPWQMTRKEFLEFAKARAEAGDPTWWDLYRPYSSNEPDKRAIERLTEEIANLEAAPDRYVRDLRTGETVDRYAETIAKYKEAIEEAKRRIAMSHEGLVAKALAEGKPVPPEVLKDYPDLAEQAKTSAQASEIKEPEYVGEPGIPIRVRPVRASTGKGYSLMDQDGTRFGKITESWEEIVQRANKENRRLYELELARKQAEAGFPKLEWGKDKPGYIKTLQSNAANRKFFSEAREVGWIDQPYGHKVPVYYHDGKLVRVNEGRMHQVNPADYPDHFHWRNRIDVVPIAKKFGAEVSIKRIAPPSDIEAGTMGGTLKIPQTTKVVITQPKAEPAPVAPAEAPIKAPEPAKPAAPAPQPEAPTAPVVEGVQVTENEEKDGVEIRFPSKPDTSVIAQLHRLGFRWSPKQKLWYAKRTPERLEFARSLAGQPTPAQAEITTVPEVAKEQTAPAPAVEAPKLDGTRIEPRRERVEAPQEPQRGIMKAEQAPTEEVVPSGRGAAIQAGQVGGHGAPALEGAPAQDVSRAGEEGPAAEGGVRGRAEHRGSAVRSDRERHGPVPSGRDSAGDVGAAPGRGGRPAPGGGPGPASVRPRNLRIDEELARDLEPKGQKEKFRRNVAAIRLLKQIEAEGRPATPEEQAVLARYSGWGGLPQVFDEHNPDWSKEYAELRELLTEEEYRAARSSTKNAHYSSPAEIGAMWDAVRKMGFEGGRVLEPAAGVGHFLGLVPREIASRTRFTAIELDSISGRIAKLLYPESDVRVQGFEEAEIPDNFYDLAISNVPFGNYPVHDPRYKKAGMTQAIHNYFFAKALDKVRPGGVVIFITSRYTMDSQRSAAREYIANRADLLMAVRLPNTAQKGAGTEVTTDILVLRKREPGTEPSGEQWMETVKVQLGENWWDSADVNEYFQRHPKHILGKQSLAGGMYRAKEYTVEPDGRDLEEALKKAFSGLPEDALAKPQDKATEGVEPEVIMPPSDKLRHGAFGIVDGKLVQRDLETGEIRVVDAEGKAADRLRHFVPLKNALRDYYRLQLEDAPDSAIKLARGRLNKLYDEFVGKFGPLHDRANQQALRPDPDFYSLLAIEEWDATEKKARKGVAFRERTIQRPKPVERTETAEEALAVTLAEKGHVDLDHIARLVGKTPDEVAQALSGRIFLDPDDGWQTADEYLSGDVREKLRRAETAAALDPAYRANVEALRAVQPPKKGADKIRVNLHSSWLPPDVIVQFASRVTNIPEDEIRANFSTLTGHWVLETTVSPSAYLSRFSTPAMKAWHILECLVDGRKPVVWTTDKDGKRVVDVQETALARERAAEMLAEFQKWIWADPRRKARLEEIYNNTFNNLRPRQFDGSHLTFPGMSPAWKEKLRPYQKNAIWRIIQGGNTVLAHPVGAGKTAEMVAAAMELKRLGLVRKPMFVVPNHMVEQFAADFLSLYPGANILVSRAEDVREDRLAHFVARVAAGNWDAVIIRHSSFSRIPVSPEAEHAFIEGIIAEIEKHLRQAREEQRAEAEGSYWRHGRKSKKDTRFIKQLEKTLERLRVRLKKIEERMDRAKLAPHFEQMGVDALFVDEAHYFKNLFYYTKLRGVKGLGDPDGAAKAFDLLMKVRYLQRLNGGRGVVFATGTPVSNSMVELYTLMRYLRPDLLQDLNIEALDAWLSVFGRVETTLEAKPDGTYGFADRLAKFLNPGELLLRWRSFADVVLPDELNIERPKLRGGKRHIVVSEASDALRVYIMRLAERLEAIRKGRVKPQEDNYLQVTNDGRLAAIDMRLVDPTAPDDPTSKVNRAVENIYNIWKETEKDRLTQVVFLDTGVPKSESRGSKKHGTKQRASEVDVEEDIEAVEQETAEEQRRRIALYNDIKAKLIERGVPEGEIAFIHHAKTDQQKQQLFEQVKAGRVRIVLGSTGKMGVGTNMQRRLIALHHLDVPWRPADLEQREGRILRPGNINPEVDIYLYVTKGSFDEYLWQLIESKARMVNQLLTVGTDDTEIEDPAGAAIVSDAAVARAIASDKPEVMEHVQVSARLQHLKAAKAAWLSEKAALAERVAWLPRHLKSLQEGLEKVRDDIANRPDTKGDAFRIVIGGKTYTSRQEADAALKEAVAKARRMQTNEVIGKIGDFRIVFDWVADVKSDTGVISLQRKGRYQVLPSIASIEGTLRHLEDAAKKDEEAIKDTQEELETLRTRLSETFPQEEEIAKLELRLQELERILAGQTDAEADLDLVAAQSQTEEGVGAEEGEEILGMPDVVYPAPPPARRSGEGAPTPPVGRQHIIRYIEDAFLVPMRSGRLTKKQARGEYKARQQVVRTKVPNDLPAAFHELGHHLQGVLGLKREDLLVCASELRPLGEELYPNADLAAKLREGAAEFVRLYISQPSDAETAAPMFRDVFEARLDSELRTKLEELRALYRTYATETAEERLAANIVKSAEPEERLLPPSKRAYNDWVDDLHVVYRAMKELTPEPIRSEWDVPIDRNIYVLARLARASARAATALLVDKMVTPELEAAGPSYRDILKPLGKRVDQFFRWMVARRIVELAGQGRPSGFDITPEEAQLIVEKYDSPEFRKAAEQYKAWRANLLEWLVDSGAISREQATKMKAMNENYVPFYRVFGEGERGPGRGKRLVDLPQGVHRYRGSSRPIWDPIQSDIRDAFFLMDIAKRSYVAKALAELADKAEGKGWLVEKVPPPVEANKVELEQLKEALIDAGVPEEDLDAADLERMATVFAPTRFARWKEKREHIFAIRRGDKVEFYQVHPELYRALEALDAQTAHWFVRLLASLSRALHVGALSTPDFALRNIARDSGSKTLYTKGPIWMLPLDFVRGMAHILGKSDAYAEWQAAGGALASQVSLSRPELERRARWLLGNLTRKEKVVEALRMPLTLLETLVNLTDEATRVGEYLRVSKQLGGGREAKLWGAYAGREVSLDFQRAGRLGREANMMWRFFNPQIQGIDKLMREFRRDPAKILVRGALITLISLITYLLNRDKPEYKEEARWRKDLYWCYYPAPGVAIYIPKPHEQGIIFGSFVERFLEWADEKDPKAMEELAKSAFDAVSPSVLPTAMMGLWEQATNRSALPGAPIVPASEQRLEPAEQYGPYTTAAAKALGRALNISPRRIEAAVRAYTGGLGMMGLELLDILAGEAQTKKTTEELIPGVRAFVGRPLRAPPSVEEFYKELNRLDREWATYLRKLKRGEMTAPIPEGALRRGTLKASESFMKFYREERDRILHDRTIPPAEKRQKLFELQARILDEARRALGKEALYH